VKYPYERFLRFLVSRKVPVNHTLERYGLPPAGDMWFALCRSNLRASAPYAIQQYIDSRDEVLSFREGVLEWAQEEKIYPLWAMQAEFESVTSPALNLAFRLFTNPHSRAVLGMLLLSRATEKETAAIMKERFDVELDPQAASIYRDIFWDVAMSDRTSWAAFAETLESQEEKNYIAFGLSWPAIEDVRDLLNLDITLDHRMILNQVTAKSYMKFKQHMEQPNQEGAMRWAELAIKAIGTAKAVGSLGAASDKVVNNNERFKGLFSVEPTKSNHPTLADLAGEIGKREPVKAPDK
jgi:hypothetical protein